MVCFAAQVTSGVAQAADTGYLHSCKHCRFQSPGSRLISYVVWCDALLERWRQVKWEPLAKPLLLLPMQHRHRLPPVCQSSLEPFVCLHNLQKTHPCSLKTLVSAPTSAVHLGQRLEGQGVKGFSLVLETAAKFGPRWMSGGSYESI